MRRLPVLDPTPPSSSGDLKPGVWDDSLRVTLSQESAPTYGWRAKEDWGRALEDRRRRAEEGGSPSTHLFTVDHNKVSAGPRGRGRGGGGGGSGASSRPESRARPLPPREAEVLSYKRGSFARGPVHTHTHRPPPLTCPSYSRVPRARGPVRGSAPDPCFGSIRPGPPPRSFRPASHRPFPPRPVHAWTPPAAPAAAQSASTQVHSRLRSPRDTS